MIRIQNKILVQKAKRPPWKVKKTYARSAALSKQMQGAVKVNVIKGIEKFKTKVDPQAVYEAWLSKDYHSVMETIPWQDLHKDMGGYSDALDSVMDGVVDFSIDALPAPISNGLRFDLSNPAIRNYVDNRTADLVVGIQNDTQSFIQGAIARQFDEAMSPRRVADLIKPQIGLYPGQVTALQNYRNGLEKNGLPESQIAKFAAQYEQRLLDYRASMIARTETRFAFNNGQLSIWNSAASQGLIDKSTARKTWVVDGNPCPECIAMGEEYADGIPLHEFFLFGDDDEPIQCPPGHPHCECGMELDLGDTQDKMEDNEPDEEGDADA